MLRNGLLVEGSRVVGISPKLHGVLQHSYNDSGGLPYAKEKTMPKKKKNT